MIIFNHLILNGQFNILSDYVIRERREKNTKLV